MENGMIKSVVFACAASAFALAGLAEVSFTNRELVVDSPFELKIGSAEYAKMFGTAVHSYTSRRFDYELGAETNYVYRSASARLRSPYFGLEQMSLSFHGDDRKLESVRAYRSYKNRNRISMEECRGIVEKIAADIDSRFGLRMADSMYVDAADKTMSRLDELRAEYAEKKKNTKAGSRTGSFSISFCSAHATKEIDGVEVDLSVLGFIDNNTNCEVNIEMERHVDRPYHHFSPGRSDGKIPVYTNSAASAGMGLPVTDEQKKAHGDAAKIRAVVKSLFGVDFDEVETPLDTNRLPDPDKADDLVSKPEWSALETPFAGMTERKRKQSMKLILIPFCTFSLRHAYDGDVSEEEMQACARRFVEEFEAALGEKIPPVEPKNDMMKKLGSGVPAFGDVRVILQFDKKQAFLGRVGDMVLDITYAPPRYVRKNGRHEIAMKGAVVVTFTQSPLLSSSGK